MSSIEIQIDSLKNYISTASKNPPGVDSPPKKRKKKEEEEVKDTFCAFFFILNVHYT